MKGGVEGARSASDTATPLEIGDRLDPSNRIIHGHPTSLETGTDPSLVLKRLIPQNMVN